VKGWAAGRVLERVDRFAVHARSEAADYAAWLGLDRSRFRFVPLQRGRLGPLPPSPIAGSYIVSMGSANRDYRTLAEAVRGTGIRTVVIAKRDLLQALPPTPEIVGLHGLGQDECNSILAGAALNVVPIRDGRTASGQVTFTTAMRLGVATVATRCVGTVDYIVDGETGLLVPSGDALSMRGAIEILWRDETRRRQLAEAGRRHADAEFSDEAAGRHLAKAIDEVLAA
jgi:glycosyltransferase involved in cell wall biosynthesis